MFENKESAEKAVLICADTGEYDAESSLVELSELAKTAGAEVVCEIVQKREAPDGATYIGSGKLKELCDFCRSNEVDVIIADGELSPSQQRNIENETDVRVIDRTTLILDIFAMRALSGEGKLQVELAQLKYLLPRLGGKGVSMSRLGGGIGTRGPGETKLETDRRHIRHRISSLEAELKELEARRARYRERRKKDGAVTVALVGYTNAGKSTLMNALTNAGVLAENKLFATLDTTVRKVIVENLPFLLSDTVGFIRKLPTELVESFKSTLDEVREADLLVHVVDISHPTFEEQIEVVNKTLSEIDKTEKPVIMVFNKVDAFSFVPKDEDDLTPKTRENISLDEFKQTWMAKMQDNCIFISAKEKVNIDALKTLLYERVKEIHITRFPYNDFLFQQYDVE